MSLYLGNTVIAPNASNVADKSLSNINDAGKITIVNNIMPSTAVQENLVIGASGTNYIAPTDGYYYVEGTSTSNISNVISLSANWINLYATFGALIQGSALMPVKKGDTCVLSYQQNATISYFKFIYAKGTESEAS